MLFNSYVFLCAFLPLSVAGFYLLAHRSGAYAARIWLCLASLFFYGWWNAAFLLLLMASIAFNYALSVFLEPDTGDGSRGRGWLLAGGIVANLLLLFYYKYLFPLLGFLHDSGWLRADFGSVMLPLGISFFTFTQIGYLVDCRQGLVRERGLINYLLFVSFFPHLIAGPILHHREIMPQFADPATYRFKADNLAAGLTLFAFGLAKKVLLADAIAPWAEAGFAHPAQLPFAQAWSVVLAYSMQLYFDFSGYSDMALGIGIMFGVRMPLNFNSPYKAASIIDFWQRWHMTLTRYLTLLLYNPISLWVARRRQQRGLPSGRQAAATLSGFSSMLIFPTMTAMTLMGVWHGAGPKFVIFGVLNGLYLCVNHAWRSLRAKPDTSQQQPLLARAWSRLWPVALTFVAVLAGQIFFRADSTLDALSMLAGMSGAPLGPTSPLSLHESSFHGIAHHTLLELGLLLIAFGAPNVYQIMGASSPALTHLKLGPGRWPAWRPSISWALLVVALLFMASGHFNAPARFLYFQF